MKRKKLAFILAAAMLVTAIPANALTGLAEETVAEAVEADAWDDEAAEADGNQEDTTGLIELTVPEEAEINAGTASQEELQDEPKAETDSENAEPAETEEEASELSSPEDLSEAVDLPDASEEDMESLSEEIPTEELAGDAADETAAEIDEAFEEVIQGSLVETVEIMDDSGTDGEEEENSSLPTVEDWENAVSISAYVTGELSVTLEAGGKASYRFATEDDQTVCIKAGEAEVRLYLYDEPEETFTLVEESDEAKVPEDVMAYELHWDQQYLIQISSAEGGDYSVGVCHFYGSFVRYVDVDADYQSEARLSDLSGFNSCQWYQVTDENPDGELIDGANSSEYIISSVKESEIYYCAYSYDYYYRTSYFYVNPVYVSYEGDSWEEIVVSRFETATLSVTARSLSGGTLTYGWYKGDDDESSECLGTGSQLTVPSGSSRYADYVCYITDSATETWVAKHFSIYWRSSLEVTYDDQILALEGSTPTLRVSVTSPAEAGAVRYQWYYYDKNENKVALSGTGASYTVPAVTENGYYYCEVRNEYDIYEADFYVKKISLVQAGVLNASGTTVNIQQAGTYSRYSYVPAQTGLYEFYSSSDYDTYGILYDVKGVQLCYDDDGGTENNFSLQYHLVAGQTYYVCGGFFSATRTGSYPVYGRLISASHPVTTVSRTAATCVSEGKVTYKCSTCGYEFYEYLPASAAAHKWSAWTVTTAPTVLAAGVQTRKCTVCGKTETASVAKLAATVSANVSSIPLKVGQSTTKVKVTYGTGDSIVSWKSSNKKIAKVNSKGKITGVKKGTATITATLASGLTAKIKVKVQKTEVATKKITNLTKKLTVKKGKKATLSPILSPITSVQKITYSTSNKKVVTVTSKGVVKGVKKGKAKITVKAGKKSYKITVTVK